VTEGQAALPESASDFPAPSLNCPGPAPAPVHGAALDLAEHRGVGERGLEDDDEEGEADGDAQAELDAEEEGAQESGHPHEEVAQVGLAGGGGMGFGLQG
jgi:hypothetical protein